MILGKTLTISICSIQASDGFTWKALNEGGELKIYYNSGNEVVIVK